MDIWVQKAVHYLISGTKCVYRGTDSRGQLTRLPTFAKYKVTFLELSLFIVEDKYALATWHTFSFSNRLN